ncbi:MAG: hypothetical protein ACHQYQ_05440, partial [Bacteriovoracales bacterium]
MKKFLLAMALLAFSGAGFSLTCGPNETAWCHYNQGNGNLVPAYPKCLPTTAVNGEGTSDHSQHQCDHALVGSECGPCAVPPSPETGVFCKYNANGTVASGYPLSHILPAASGEVAATLLNGDYVCPVTTPFGTNCDHGNCAFHLAKTFDFNVQMGGVKADLFVCEVGFHQLCTGPQCAQHYFTVNTAPSTQQH